MGIWDDPTTWWLNVTNAALGVVCAVPIVLVAAAALHDALRSWRERQGRA